MSELPPGFVLDHTEHAIPAGFSLDKPSATEDALKSIGAGLASATAGVLGMGGNVRSALSAGTDFVGGKLGASPESIQAFKDAAAKAAPLGAMLPTSRDVINSAPDPIVSPDYQPQYKLGNYLKTGAEFVPGMLMGGPEGLAPRFLTNVAAPAIASETAGQLTKGTAAEPYARLGGALLSGAGASAVERALANRVPQAAVPTGEELLKRGGDQFKQAENMNLVVKPDFAQSAAADIRQAVRKFDPEGPAKGVLGAADRLEGLASGPVAMNDVEFIRKQLVSLKTSPDPSVREAAREGIKALQGRQLALTPADVISGDAADFVKLNRDAIGNWAAGKRSAAVTGKADLAELNAGTAGLGANQDNAMRQAIKQLARPQNNTNIPVAKKLGFNDQEVAAIKQAATGTVPGNVMRALGKAAPTGIVSAALSGGAGHVVGGPIGAVGLPVAGYIAKKLGDLSTNRAVSALDTLVRSRSPLATQVAAQLPPQITGRLPARSQRILQSLSIAAPAVQQQGSQRSGQPVS